MDRFKFRVWDKYFKCYWTDEQVKTNIQWLLYPDNANIENFIIEQCTGLKDKNGKLIYEWDIVTDGVDIFEVVWDYNAWCIQTNNFQHFLTEGFEIIGNIHENADLLGEK